MVRLPVKALEEEVEIDRREDLVWSAFTVCFSIFDGSTLALQSTDTNNEHQTKINS